jgi:hypothetical protein
MICAATVAMQRRCKHASTTIRGLFSVWSVPRSYLEENWSNAGSCQLRGSSVRKAVKKKVGCKSAVMKRPYVVIPEVCNLVRFL